MVIPKIMSKSLAYFLILFFSLIYLVVGEWTIKSMSLTYDEGVHLASGYTYLVLGDYRLNIRDHPPLTEMIAAIPLLFLKPILPLWHRSWIYGMNYSFSEIFIYHNKIDADTLLNWGRRAILVPTLFFYILIFYWSSKLFNNLAGIFSFILSIFSSSFFVHSTLVTTDMIFCGFYFTTFFCLWKLFKSNKWLWSILSGVSLGCCFASKFSAIIILPILLLLFFLPIKKPSVIKIIAPLFVAIFVISIFYRGEISLYKEGLSRLLFAVGDKAGRSSFLMGKYSTSGWKNYFLIAFLLKSSLPLLISTVISLLFLFRKTLYKETIIFLLVPAILYFLVASNSKIQIGHRHILPIYPFLFVLCGRLMLNKFWKIIAILLTIWHIFAFFKIHPYHLTYFNELIGGPKNGYKYLVDSNLDWGQGLKELAKFLKQKGINQIYLSYFGTADPNYYNIQYIPVGFVTNVERNGNDINILKLNPQIFAISATNLQMVYYADKTVFSILKNKKPIKVIYNSIFLYDITKDIDVHTLLMKIFEMSDMKNYLREKEYLKILIKK